jgi:hypothetical protein
MEVGLIFDRGFGSRPVSFAIACQIKYRDWVTPDGRRLGLESSVMDSSIQAKPTAA